MYYSVSYNYKYSAENSTFKKLPDVNKSYCKGNAHHEIILGNDETALNILNKISEGCIPLEKVSESKRGAEVGKKFLKENTTGVKALIGADINKYSINWCETYLPISHKEYSRLYSFSHLSLFC